MTELRFLYVTVPDPEQAMAIGRTLVEERLAACANILPGMTSVYRWEGAIETAREAVMIVKTRAALVEAATLRIKALHPYQVPCVVALPVEGGNPDYLGWLRAET